MLFHDSLPDGPALFSESYRAGIRGPAGTAGNVLSGPFVLVQYCRALNIVELAMNKQARLSLLMPGLIFALAGPAAAAETWREKVTAFAAKNLQERLTYSHSRRRYR